ncbi:hypothetical protein IPL85_01365 [Candidatus Saccharibacteria bacterium]|nr:MAG: hypothetical protein IPL85_01365 [Candidatus Saccharibacteria bacterium]
MKKKQKIVLFGLLIAILIFGLAYYFVGQNSDKCTAADRAQNNCVPAGRCTPPGDPREAVIDCGITDYDHKFSQ